MSKQTQPSEWAVERAKQCLKQIYNQLARGAANGSQDPIADAIEDQVAAALDEARVDGAAIAIKRLDARQR